jgi:monoamine oxidase
MDSHPGGEGFIEAGYSSLIDRLSRGLDIRYEHVVSKVQYSESGVTVSTLVNGAFSGCVALVTVPLGVLKSTDKKFVFEPELPREHRDAIAALKMGLLNKVHLQFKDPWWSELDPHHYSYGYLGSQGHSRKNDWDQFFAIDFERRAAGTHYITFFNGGRGAWESEDMTRENVRDHVMSILRTVAKASGFKSAVPDPISYNVTRWGKDPYARGSYSYTPVGVDDAVRVKLAASVADRLFFAGEATSRTNYQSVDGALTSGSREAGKISKLLGLGDVAAPPDASSTDEEVGVFFFF